MEETGWKGADFSSLAEGPKPPEKNDKKSEKKARAKTSWAELVSKASDNKGPERRGMSMDREKDSDALRQKPKLEASLLGVQKEEVNTQKSENSENSELNTTNESLDEVAELSTDEKLEVVKQTSREGHSAAVEEQSGLEPGDPNLAAAQAAEKFHELLGEQTGSDIVASLDAAEAQAVEQIMQDTDPETEETEDEVDDDNAQEIEAETDYVDDESVAANPVTPSGPQPPMTNVSPSAPIPSPPPSPPFTPNSPPAPPIVPISPTPSVPSPNTPNFPATPSSPNRNHNMTITFGEQSKHSHWPYVLTGGVVGYLIGRRRGRIKTEEKLLPIQKSLESEVQDLQWQVASREAKVRALAYERAKTKLILDAEPKSELAPTKMHEQTSEHSDTEAADSTESQNQEYMPDQDRQNGQNKEISNNDDFAINSKFTEPGIESSPSFIPVPALEFNDNSKLKAEQAIESRYASGMAKEDNSELKEVSTMNNDEIMQIAKSISVEGVDLWRMYKLGRLTESGLRRVVSAYLNGEDIDAKLRENLQEYESIERYPALGDLYSDEPVRSLESQQVGFPNNQGPQEYPVAPMLSAEQSKDFAPELQAYVQETGATEPTETDTQQSIIVGAIIGFCIAVAGILMYLLIR